MNVHTMRNLPRRIVVLLVFMESFQLFFFSVRLIRSSVLPLPFVHIGSSVRRRAVSELGLFRFVEKLLFHLSSRAHTNTTRSDEAKRIKRETRDATSLTNSDLSVQPVHLRLFSFSTFFSSVIVSLSGVSSAHL